jgi:hypothetical protein
MQSIATIDDLHRACDGAVPHDLLRLALRAPERVARAAQTRLIVHYHDKVVIEQMAESIVEVNAATGGTVTEGDLLLRGYSREQIARHRGAALRLARPRLRDCAA